MTAAIAEKERRVIQLHPHQVEMFAAREPYLLALGGIRSGKTFGGRYWLANRAMRFPKAAHMATCNTYDQMELVTIPNLIEAFETMGVDYTHQKSVRRFLLHHNGVTSEILYRSTENFDKIRGTELGSCWMDEIRDAKTGAVEVIQGRMSSPHVDIPQVLATTSPNGYDQIYDIWIDNGVPGTHRVIEFKTTDNKSLRADYIANLRRGYDPDMVLQELEGKIINLGKGQVYRRFNRTIHVKRLKYDPDAPLILCVDFNIGHMGWVLCQMGGNGEVHVVGEVYCVDSTIGETAIALGRDWGGHRGPWKLYGDASDGRSRHTGETDWQALLEGLKRNGINPEVFKDRTNPHPKDRVHSMNHILEDGEGTPRLFIDESCQQLRRDFEQLVWKSDGNDIDKNKDQARSHVSDALGYFIHKEFPYGPKSAVHFIPLS